MAVGPIQFAAGVGFRSVAPMAYANPFNGGLVSWIADPNNTMETLSYVIVGLVACSAIWLVNGAMVFFETRKWTAIIAVFVALGLMLMLAEGDKLDPTNWQHITTCGMFLLAYLSAAGRLFAITEDQKESKS